MNLYSKECLIPLQSNGPAKDCIHCAKEVVSPGEKVAGLIKPIVNFVTDSDEQKAKLIKLKSTAYFLNSSSNKLECANYKNVMQSFSQEFQKNLVECEKGLDLLEKKKIVCTWILNTYNEEVISSFYSHWSTVNSNGKAEYIAGRSIDQIEGPIRAQHSWCKKISVKNKGKILDIKNADRIDLLVKTIKEELVKEYDIFIVKINE